MFDENTNPQTVEDFQHNENINPLEYSNKDILYIYNNSTDIMKQYLISKILIIQY